MGFGDLKKTAESKFPHVEIASFDQGDVLKIIRDSKLSEVKLGGLCFELCRRYVAAVLGDDFQVGETCYDVIWGPSADLSGPDAAYLQDLIAKHVARNKNEDGNYDVAGLSRDGQAVRAKSGLQFTVLRSREDVLNHMFLNDGAYIYVFTGKDGGHAVAFEVSTERILFFDPNCGELCIPKPTKKDRENLLDWWRSFWKAYYKNDMHNGSRKLVRYSLNPA